MRYLSLAIALLGIFVLIMVNYFYPPKEISGYEDLILLQANTKVISTGQVISERFSPSGRTLVLDNNLTIFYPRVTLQSYLDKKITFAGTVEDYRDQKTIRAYSIEMI